MSHPLNSFENNSFEQCFGGTRVLFQIIVHSVGRVCYPVTQLSGTLIWKGPMTHLSKIAYLLMRNFNENFYNEVDCLWRVFVNFHQPNAIGKEVHKKVKKDGHIVHLGGLSNATQGLQRGRDLLLHLLLLACLWEVLLVYHSQEPLLKRLKNLENKAWVF